MSESETSSQVTEGAELDSDHSESEKKSTSGSTRREVAASTITQMMGIATRSEIELLEGKIDLLTSKINTLTIRLEKISTTLQKTPTGSDLERIDVNIGGLKTLIRDALRGLPDMVGGKEDSVDSTAQETAIIEAADQDQEGDEEDDESLQPRIFSNQQGKEDNS